MSSTNFGTFEERTGINSQFFDEQVKQVARQLRAEEDPLATVKKAYPRIYKMIMDLWGTELLHIRLTKMVALDTEGRQGFDKPTGAALMSIHDLHMAKFKFEPIWNIPDMRRDTW
jgi:hypothetical protein